MGSITNEIMFEVLKSIQLRLDGVERHLKDIAHGQIRIREDINILRGDDLRREVLQAQLDVRLERIETRLNLNEV